MPGIPYVPCWVCTLLYIHQGTPSWVHLTTRHQATVQAPRHRESPVTALAHRVAELTVTDACLTVTRFTVGLSSTTPVSLLVKVDLSLRLYPMVVVLGAERCVSLRPSNRWGMWEKGGPLCASRLLPKGYTLWSWGLWASPVSLRKMRKDSYSQGGLFWVSYWF